MGNGLGNKTTVVQNTSNSISNRGIAACNVSNVDEASGNIVIVTDSTVGNISGAVIKAKTDISCTISNQMDATIEAIINNNLSQTLRINSDPINININAGKNSAEIRQSIANQISSVLESTCSMSTINVANNNLVLVSNSKGGDVIGASIDSNTSSICTLNNTAKLTSASDSGNKIDQGAEITGAINRFFGVIAAVIAVVLIVFIVLLVFGGVGFAATKLLSSGGKSDDSNSVELDEILSA